MIDRENVIKWLNDEISDTVVTQRTNPWRDIHYRVPVDTLKAFAELLKEQPEIIRCKDCKYMERLPWLDDEDFKAMVCRKHNYTGMRKEDFFCADGERR